MTELERLFRHLVQTLSAADPARLRQPIPLADIRGSIIPYRTNRRALQIDSSEDYELALIRLCAGEGGFASLSPDDARARFEHEAASQNPELGIVRQFADALVMLAPSRIAAAMAPAAMASADSPDALVDRWFTEQAREPTSSVGAELVPSPSERAAPAADPLPDTVRGIASVPPPAAPRVPRVRTEEEIPSTEDELPSIAASATGGTHCVACAEVLPTDRLVKFCPYCGKSQIPQQCFACSADLEPGWRYCAACGRST